jgi:predicted GIY-YIG superfamily endonuclease
MLPTTNDCGNTKQLNRPLQRRVEAHTCPSGKGATPARGAEDKAEAQPQECFNDAFTKESDIHGRHHHRKEAHE